MHLADLQAMSDVRPVSSSEHQTISSEIGDPVDRELKTSLLAKLEEAVDQIFVLPTETAKLIESPYKSTRHVEKEKSPIKAIRPYSAESPQIKNKSNVDKSLSKAVRPHTADPESGTHQTQRGQSSASKQKKSRSNNSGRLQFSLNESEPEERFFMTSGVFDSSLDVGNKPTTSGVAKDFEALLNGMSADPLPEFSSPLVVGAVKSQASDFQFGGGSYDGDDIYLPPKGIGTDILVSKLEIV